MGSEEAGLVSTGSTRRRRSCLTASSALVCAVCGRTPRPDEIAENEWRCYLDGVGELHMFCPERTEREFGVRVRRPSG